MKRACLLFPLLLLTSCWAPTPAEQRGRLAERCVLLGFHVGSEALDRCVMDLERGGNPGPRQPAWAPAQVPPEARR